MVDALACVDTVGDDKVIIPFVETNVDGMYWYAEVNPDDLN